ncbi:glutamine-hydrolyzing GMP synthase [Cerasicoccus arenae]|uniref:GMP synthase [glutamine-hydrolyzing] n=1 Tax=Cerasicoccus arenae TaxID=424488 RepID=A0A8J3DK39_9BACT|nr:glutamine-hydrolyzing GMP synthase [Cerasicoccus arenae]MBK1857356.1 glutamine-hydrolyzing GMP synthase [Cerasicoccus arenae]GHC08966.1 GMP synthase [glutamine-hydrolyzing] [Cerasicoccus arenae]
MSQQTLAVLDFGSQYTQVIARRIRECQVYSRIYPYSVTAAQLKKDGVCGIILSGGPSSVLAKNAPLPDKKLFKLGVPVLGICYGVQLMGKLLGGEVARSERREYGRGAMTVKKKGALLKGLPKKLQVWNSHGDKLTKIPAGFEVIAYTENSENSVIADEKRGFYGIQFHPEVHHSERGVEILQNFLFGVCKCKADWKMANYIEEATQLIRDQVGNKRVILGLSGGVDSSVAAALIHRAIGDQLTCVFVDNGLLRLKERERVEQVFRDHFHVDLRVIKAGNRFLSALKGVTDPERKRKIIGKVFIDVFEDAVKSIGEVDFLAQGTLYPDVIESVAIDGNPAALIKSHHNVGGLPKRMRMKLLEPLRELFKDEVRRLGEELGLPKEMIWRHPFPGPGLGVRVMGEIKRKYLTILKQADAVLLDEMKRTGHYEKVWQAFCVFLPVKTVGVMGDERTYDYVVALRIVESQDAMTADWAHIPHNVLGVISNRIINEVEGVNRVVLDISSKPPSTIEWE